MGLIAVSCTVHLLLDSVQSHGSESALEPTTTRKKCLQGKSRIVAPQAVADVTSRSSLKMCGSSL